MYSTTNVESCGSNLLAYNFPIVSLKHKASFFVYLPIFCLLKSTRCQYRCMAAKRRNAAATCVRIPLVGITASCGRQVLRT